MSRHHLYHLYLVVTIYGVVIFRSTAVVAFQAQQTKTSSSWVYQQQHHSRQNSRTIRKESSVHHRICQYQRYDSSALQLHSSISKEDTYTYTQIDSNNDNSSIDATNCHRDLEHVLHIIERAAYLAGEIALSTAGKIAVKDTKANTRDLVTESDVACQNLIKEIILKEFPINDVFLGEEGIDLSGDSSAASSDALKEALGILQSEDDNAEEDRLLFVVDPIGKLLCCYTF